MKKVKKWWLKFISPTPAKWKSIRNSFGSIGAAITAGLLGVNAVGIVLPDTTVKYLGYAVFITLAIAAYAQSHEVEIPIKKIRHKQKTPQNEES